MVWCDQLGCRTIFNTEICVFYNESVGHERQGSMTNTLLVTYVTHEPLTHWQF